MNKHVVSIATTYGHSPRYTSNDLKQEVMRMFSGPESVLIYVGEPSANHFEVRMQRQKILTARYDQIDIVDHVTGRAGVWMRTESGLYIRVASLNGSTVTLEFTKENPISP